MVIAMKKGTVLVVILMSLFGWNTGKAQSVYPGQHNGKIKENITAPLKAYSFDLKQVKLLPSRFRENMMRDSAWMMSIDTKRLLHSFRTNAGVYSANEGGYFTMKKMGGWESLDCDLRGHTTGHLLSALALMYASTGNDAFKIKADSLVKGLAEVQLALGKSGYLSAFPEGLIDRNIAGKGVWAPWYTLHKIYAGLIDQYLYCDNKQALDVVIKMADWAYNKLIPLSDEVRRKMIRNEFGGVGECFYNLYSITGDIKYETLAKFFYHNEVIEPLADDKDELAGKHANTFIPKLIAEARNYELNNDGKSKKEVLNFWNNVVNSHSFVTGSNSDKEKFFDHNHLSEHLTGYTGETCNTYNLLKLTRHMFCWDANPRYADYYERALYNHILGQQDPETCMVAYFLPMLSGAHKVYSTKENSFWCCVGSGFESHAKYGEAIYYHDDNGIYVNLFISSELTWKEKGVKLTQETLFPEKESTILTLHTKNKIKMNLYLRYPSWTKNVVVKVNGKKLKVKQVPDSYIVLNRVWKDGDRIEVTYPMKLRTETTPDNDKKVAILYGPLVLAGEMGTENLIKCAPYSNPNLYNDYYTYNYNVPSSLKTVLNIDKNNIEKDIKRIDGRLRFKAAKENIILEPLYNVHRQRYVVYWDWMNPNQ